MSEQLRELIIQTQQAFRDNPEKAKATFSSASNIKDGLRSEVAIRGHGLTVDEPQSLGGTDKGPNPVELVLAALGTCQEITYRAYAAALQIPLERVSVTLDGEIDLRGFFGVDDTVPPGYGSIRGTVALESSADDEQLAQLRQAVNAHCPVLDILSRPMAVDLQLAVSRPVEQAQIQ